MVGIPILHKVHGSNKAYTERTAISQNFYTVAISKFAPLRQISLGVVWEALQTNSLVTTFYFKHLLQRPFVAALGQWPSVFLPSETESKQEEKSLTSIFASSSLKYIWDRDE